VLVVDDQDDVREVAVAQLEALGFRVAQASNAKAALELLARGDIDLLMADYAMPGTSGIELARAARARQPTIPVLLMSGYVETTRIDRQVEGARLVKKPYRLAELVDAIESLLRNRAARRDRPTVIPLRARED
jgi:CheY-like chemotaxis protein